MMKGWTTCYRRVVYRLSGKPGCLKFCRKLAASIWGDLSHSHTGLHDIWIVRLVVIGPMCDRSAMVATISSSGRIPRSISTRVRAIVVSWDRDFVYIYIYSAIFNRLGVYFIVCSGTGPWARVRSFRLLRGPTVSRAFGEFE